MKSIRLTSAATLVAIAFGAISTTAHAADIATYDTHGYVSFVGGGTEITPPVDPLDPTAPAIPLDPTNPTAVVPQGTGGPLSIDFASSFNFGSNNVSSIDQTYNAAPQKFVDPTDSTKTVVGPNYVQVTDNRGTLSGWSLSVKQETQFDTGATTAPGTTLTGAELSLNNGQISTTSATPANIKARTTKLVPGVQSNIILGATVNNGAGTNLLHFGDATNSGSSVQLFVPGATTKLADSYSADLNWILSDTPVL